MNYIIKSWVLIVVFVFLNKTIYSQNIDNDKAHRRYWYYRTRMINDFMKVGKNQGDCIVFAQRNRDQNSSNDFAPKSTTGPDQIDITNMYIMALALEYKLLTRNNQNTSETIKELYHLLYAINRLDLEAEQFWDSPEPSNDHIAQNGLLNGFIL
ncbi:MAG: hypothetical protein IT237_12725 [Bacteroidia bacterium]|nr:hypothetical protein [Bacteroidia bacterium]